VHLNLFRERTFSGLLMNDAYGSNCAARNSSQLGQERTVIGEYCIVDNFGAAGS
jgi:hypothetical protein